MITFLTGIDKENVEISPTSSLSSSGRARHGSASQVQKQRSAGSFRRPSIKKIVWDLRNHSWLLCFSTNLFCFLLSGSCIEEPLGFFVLRKDTSLTEACYTWINSWRGVWINSEIALKRSTLHLTPSKTEFVLGPTTFKRKIWRVCASLFASSSRTILKVHQEASFLHLATCTNVSFIKAWKKHEWETDWINHYSIRMTNINCVETCSLIILARHDLPFSV